MKKYVKRIGRILDLKSRAIWLEIGDENTKFFQAYAKGRKMQNTIWGLRNLTNELVMSIEYMSRMGKEHFQDLFKDFEGV